MPNTLHLVLKKKWFDMIRSGEKKEEYREKSFHWVKRLTNNKQFGAGVTMWKGLEGFKQFDTVTFQHGYQKNAPRLIVEFKGIEIGTGKSEWGAMGESFIIKLGKIIKP